MKEEADAILIFGGGPSGSPAEGVRRGLRERLETDAEEAPPDARGPCYVNTANRGACASR